MLLHSLFTPLFLFSCAGYSVWCSVDDYRGQRTLQSFFGTYLRAYKTSFSADLMSGQPFSWEHWFIDEHHGKVALRAIHSPARYLRANRDGTVDLNNRTSDWEMWTPSINQDGSWSFRSVHGRWLSAGEDRSVRTVRTRDVSEHFWLDPWTAQNPIISANWTEEVKGKRNLKSSHGTYLTAVPEAWEHELFARQGKVNMTSGPAGWWQHWHIDAYAEKVNLKAANLFLCASREGEVYLSDKTHAWDLWTPYKLENGAWAFRRALNQWLSAGKEGSVRTVEFRGDGEEFWLESWE
ncbi:hypothetical protein PMAYCL1PPCAC_32677 [Pristionchus mayeri]|uniref:Carotenoid 1,2-hydratase n=1 Tax=Pristionchus mayeri TaxID=1317129 RepID=A0AAN5DHX9_9BILA|nr:hypothetical protein PMAYCL1PPCAC_32677 [Pristionchus mayeri]